MARHRFDELQAVRLLEHKLGQRGRRRAASVEVEVGIGDDAAVVRIGRERLVWTIDACIEGTHFDRRWLSLEDVGFRSLMAAASDVAAMGAEPVGALADVTLIGASAERDLSAIATGQAEACRGLRCPMIGGNLSHGGVIGVVTTVLGRVERPLLRSSARPGDELWLVGDVGLARAGLLFLRERSDTHRHDEARSDAAVTACVDAWRRPRALIARGRQLASRARAALDVSDGLSRDVARIATASKVRIVVERAALERTLRTELVTLARRLGADPLRIALEGGEDYALVATGPKARRPRWAARIGRVERGQGAVLESAAGRETPLGDGFDHFDATR